jgi:uncharacterized protein
MYEDDVLVNAVKAGDLPQVRSLLSADPTLALTRTPEGISVVLLSIYYGHTDVAALLLESAPEMDIFEAAALGKSGRVIDLLEEDPDLINANAPDGFTPLGLAAFFRHPDTVKVLLEHGAHPSQPAANTTRVQPLHSAVASQQLAIADMLLNAGADVNARQQHGYTPLHAAAANGQLDMVYLLLKWGADLTAATENGQTPLSLAEAQGHDEVAELLKRVL